VKQVVKQGPFDQNKIDQMPEWSHVRKSV